MKMCTKCGTIFKNGILSEFNELCPIYECFGKVEDIDDLIIPTIVTLNRKGWRTEHSCSGHYGGKLNQPYILTTALIGNLFIDDFVVFSNVISKMKFSIPLSIEVEERILDTTYNSVISNGCLLSTNVDEIKHDYHKVVYENFLDKLTDEDNDKYFSIRIGINPNLSLSNGFDPMNIISNLKTIKWWHAINYMFYNLACNLPAINNKGGYLYENR